MPEKRTPVRTIVESYECGIEDCGAAVYYTGYTFKVHPTMEQLWRHRCMNGHEMDLPKEYPHVAYEPIPEQLPFSPSVTHWPSR